MSFESLLTDRIKIQTAYSSQNEMLDWTYSYSSASTNTNCRLSPISAYQRMDLAGKFDDVRYFAYFESGAQLSEGDRLIHGNETLLVREVVVDASGHHKEVLLSKIV